MIDQQTIDKVMDTAQILDVVSEFVSLKRRGVNYIGLCPFHNDRTPSFTVSPSKNICKCFSCGKGGNPAHFLMEHEQMTFYEAIRWLANRYHIDIEERKLSAEELKAQTDREGMLNLNEFAQQTFSKQLYETPEGKNVGLTYFYERGFQDAIIQKFQLGYALDDKHAFAARALKQGLQRDYLLRTGLCYGDDDGSLPIDRFRGRVIFPVHSLSGKVVAFGGRVLLRTSHTAMKYVNSPESEIYHKSNVLYGIYFAKRAITAADRCYLVEGYTDVLSMHQSGIENVVASSGTALTQNQIRMIQRFTSNITVLYDGDEAGIRASLRGIDMILKEGMNVKVLLLPDEEDPDSFAKSHTSQEFLDYIAAHETDFIRFKAALLMKDAATDPSKRAAMIKSMVTSIAIIPDPIVTSVYIRETSRLLDVPEDVLTNAVNLQKTNNFETEQKQRDIEQRRALNQSRLTQSTTPAAPTEQGSAPQVEADALLPEADVAEVTSPELAEAINSMVSRPQSVPQVAGAAVASPQQPIAQERKSLLTDRFERNVIRYIVRYGGETFSFKYNDEEGNPQEFPTRVIDFILDDLESDSIVFQHPLYAHMLELAREAASHPDQEFDSERFFTNYPDTTVSLTAIDLIADKYATMSEVSTTEDLSVMVPRCIMELKDAIIRTEVTRLKDALRQPGCDDMEILRQLAYWNDIRKVIEKELGERIITG